MTVHFVYAFDPDSGQIQSPYCITKNLYYYLKQRTDVAYYLWDSQKSIPAKPDDIILGHPHYDKRTVMHKVFKGTKCRVRCTIHPFHHKRTGDNMPFDYMARQADKIFSICGPYWYDTIGNTPFAHWKPKMVRLDMAVDCKHFPYLRAKSGEFAFNPPGRRRLTYVGSSMPQKNLQYMVALMQRMRDVELHWYGGSGDHALAKLPNVRTVGWVTLNRKTAEKIVKNCDIFINTSISDANPTTLLEARAWGLTTACTKQSGYYNDPFFTELYLDDLNRTESVIRKLLAEPTETLLARAEQSRTEIEKRYTWDRFCSSIWSELQKL
jgi:glycosyltransferase involved in cell wall biosynthesis